jgi:outer membrane immunogenic protein
MKKQLVVILATAASAVVLGGAASAADLPVYTKAPAATAAYDWSGVYIGGHIGGGWSTTGFQDPTAGTAVSAFDDGFAPGGLSGTNANTSGFLGGGQIGWMYQIARLVVGGDLDFSKTSLTGSGGGAANLGFFNFGQSATEAYSVHTDWTATSTATIGLARGEWLVYSKGGAALAHNSYNVNIAANDPFMGPFGFSAPGTSETRVGWTVGVGLKWAFWNNWFANIEYDYLDFGSKAQGFTGQLTEHTGLPAIPQNATLTPIFNERISELKFGINYKFPAESLFW